LWFYRRASRPPSSDRRCDASRTSISTAPFPPVVKAFPFFVPRRLAVGASLCTRAFAESSLKAGLFQSILTLSPFFLLMVLTGAGPVCPFRFASAERHFPRIRCCLERVKASPLLSILDPQLFPRHTRHSSRSRILASLARFLPPSAPSASSPMCCPDSPFRGKITVSTPSEVRSATAPLCD